MTRVEFETNLIILDWQKIGAGKWSQDNYEMDIFNPYHVAVIMKAGTASRIYSIGTYDMALEKLKNAHIHPRKLP